MNFLFRKYRAWRKRRIVANRLSQSGRAFEKLEAENRALTADRDTFIQTERNADYRERDLRSQCEALLAENQRLAGENLALAKKLNDATVAFLACRSKLDQSATREQTLAQKLTEIEIKGLNSFMDAAAIRSEAAQ